MKTKAKAKKSTLYMKKLKNTPAFGMTRVRFYYITSVDGRPWLADVDEDVLRNPETFKIEEEPCGKGFPDVSGMREYLNKSGDFHAPARPIGFVRRGKLFITKKIRVETGWDGPIGGMIPTRFSTIYPNV